jgi:hypothetical protein
VNLIDYKSKEGVSLTDVDDLRARLLHRDFEGKSLLWYINQTKPEELIHQSKHFSMVAQTLWHSELDASNSLLASSTSFCILSELINEPGCMIGNAFSWRNRRRLLGKAHPFTYQLWQSSVQVRYWIEVGWFALVVIALQVILYVQNTQT